MTALEEIKKALDGDMNTGLTAIDRLRFIVGGVPDFDPITVEDADWLLSTLESLQRENEELRQDRDRTARNRDMWKGQVERQADSLSKFREEEIRLRETLFQCGSFIADRYQEGDAEYQVVLLVNDAICSKPALASTGGEHHAE